MIIETKFKIGEIVYFATTQYGVPVIGRAMIEGIKVDNSSVMRVKYLKKFKKSLYRTLGILEEVRFLYMFENNMELPEYAIFKTRDELIKSMDISEAFTGAAE